MACCNRLKTSDDEDLCLSKKKGKQRYQNGHCVTNVLSHEHIPMRGRGRNLVGWEGLKSELSMTCSKGHPSVTLPPNIRLNDVPCLLTAANKAGKH